MNGIIHAFFYYSLSKQQYRKKMSKKENTLGNFLRLHHILKLFSLLIELLAMILGCASICSWMFYKWVFNNFGGGLGVDQVLWTIKFSTTGADQALLTSIYNSVYLCVALCLLWICAVYFFKRPTFIKKLLKKLKAAIMASIRFLNKFRHWHHYRKVYFAVGGVLLILIPAFSLLNALKNVNKRYSVVEYFENQQNTDGCDFIRDNYKIPSADSVIFNKKNNLVIVLGESLESKFNSSVPLAPELDKLSKSARS
ncbi:MAG: hypothetical protein ACI4M9_01130, partial [Succinivibrio sp.]